MTQLAAYIYLIFSSKNEYNGKVKRWSRQLQKNLEYEAVKWSTSASENNNILETYIPRRRN